MFTLWLEKTEKRSFSDNLLPRKIEKRQHPVHCSFNKSPRAVKCLMTNKQGDLGASNIKKVNIVHLISGLCMQFCLYVLDGLNDIRLNKYEHMKHDW